MESCAGIQDQGASFGAPETSSSSRRWESVLQRSLESGDADRIFAAITLAERGGASAKVLSEVRRKLRNLEEAALEDAVQGREQPVTAASLVTAIEHAEDVGLVKASSLEKAQAVLQQVALADLQKALAEARVAASLAAAASSGRASAGASVEAKAEALEVALRRLTAVADSSQATSQQEVAEGWQQLSALRAAAKAAPMEAEGRRRSCSRGGSTSGDSEKEHVILEVAASPRRRGPRSGSKDQRPRHQSPARVVPQVIGNSACSPPEELAKRAAESAPLTAGDCCIQ
eukprot:TRINITY_DN40975_c0_g1_i1.p1 TRINITY_DN40975_c0_g1~~TRINITY_DN40975_c0_g1_i1.p1  ORF type:complete len:288 (+),score=87.84 TRINITY_DN40975_c0_g1_i1:60-923(+)